MRTVKIATGLACGLTILLLILALSIRNSETELYDETVQMLMEGEGIDSEEERTYKNIRTTPWDSY